MEWQHVLALIASNVIIFFWLRTEANSDRRQIQQEMSADRRDLLTLMREIKDENKEFHGRLIKLEERTRP